MPKVIGMNKEEIRLKNLHLIATAFDFQKQLAAEVEIDPSYLSRLLKGVVRIDRGRAAIIEGELGLPYKWMDVEQPILPDLKKWAERSEVRSPELAVGYSERQLLDGFKKLPTYIQDATRQTILYMANQTRGTT